ncbi:MAG TPA: ABC transporter ATP-binding protein [Anaerolineales bacterium]|nr:ABC transporter ATP-binding protein [Anaerolineales bacterium]
MSDLTLNDSLRSPASPSLRQYRELLSRYLKPQIRWVILMAVVLLAGIAIKLINPQILRYFLDTAQAGGAARSLTTAAGLFLLFAILQEGMSLATHYTAALVGWSSTNRLRADLALHLLRLDMPFHKSRTPGELIDRADGDVTQLSNFLSMFTVNVIGNGLLVVGILVLLFRENAWLGLGMLVYTLLTLLVLHFIQKLAVPRWAAERQSSAMLYGYIEERISGAEEIRAAGAESYVMRRLYEYMRDFTRKTRVAVVFSSLTYNLTNLVYVLGYAAGLAVGVILYMRGEASLGTAYLITYYVGMLSDPLQSIRGQAEDLQQASANIQRINELFHLRPRVGDPLPGSTSPRKTLPDGPLLVRFRDVSFQYQDNQNGSNDASRDGVGEDSRLDQKALMGVSFEIQPGRVLGVLGRTGSGKSTLTRLLFRLYDPDQGSVWMGGMNLRELSLDDLRQRVAMVTQDVQLFQATVRDNLTFFNRSIPDEQLEHVLKQLRLWEWAQSLPNGLDTPLAGGQSLSAGEAQLLAFARVFLKKPGLVILDEASSRLDPATETLMERAVDRLFAERTGVVIAHRLKTVQRADDILILENGCVAEYGPRTVLMSDPASRFYHLLQTGLEEALA